MNRQRALGITLKFVAPLVVAGSIVGVRLAGPDDEARTIEAHADEVFYFEDLGEMLATSDAVVEATVLETEPGDVVVETDADHSFQYHEATLQIDRVHFENPTSLGLLRLSVTEELTLVEDGWEGGDPIVIEGVQPSEEEDAGFYFLKVVPSAAEAGGIVDDGGTVRPDVILTNSQGRYLVEDGQLIGSNQEDPLVQSVQALSPDQMRDEIQLAKEAFFRGDLQPQTAVVCAPPGCPEDLVPENHGTVQFRSLSSGTASCSAGTPCELAIPAPAGVQTGDVLVAVLASDAQPLPAAGWLPVRTDPESPAKCAADGVQTAYWKWVNEPSDEPGTYTWTFATLASAAGIITSYSGVGEGIPVASSGGWSAVAREEVVAPSLAATPGSQLVFGVSIWSPGEEQEFSLPEDMEERGRTQAEGGSEQILIVANEEWYDWGPTGDRVGSTGSPPRCNIAQMVALFPGPLGDASTESDPE